MAISLKTSNPGALFEKVFSTISVIFFLVVFSLGATFFYLENQQIKRKASLEKERERLMRESKELVLKQYQAQFELIKKLLDDHVFPSKLFPFLEEKFLKTIIVSELSFDTSQPLVKISAKAPDLKELIKQYLVFFQTPEISQIRLEKISVETGGTIFFSISFKVDKKILQN